MIMIKLIGNIHMKTRVKKDQTTSLDTIDYIIFKTYFVFRWSRRSWIGQATKQEQRTGQEN